MFDPNTINASQAASFMKKAMEKNPEFEQVIAKAKTYDLQNPEHKAELVEAGTFYVNEFRLQYPDNEDWTDMIFKPGTVNGSTLMVEVGYSGKAYVHARGSKAIAVQPFVNFISTQLERFSWFYMLDIHAVRDSNFVKLMTDAAEINKGLRTQKIKYVLDMLKAATLVSPIQVTAATLSQTTVNSIITKLSAYTGGVSAIIGHQNLIGQFSEFTGYSFLTQRDIEVKGPAIQYHGIPLHVVYDNPSFIIDGSGNKYETPQIDTTTLIYVGKQAGVYGSMGQQTMSGPNVKLMGTETHVCEDYAAILCSDRYFARQIITG